MKGSDGLSRSWTAGVSSESSLEGFLRYNGGYFFQRAASSLSSSPRVRHSAPRCSPPSARPEERAVSVPLLVLMAGVPGEADDALIAAARTTRHLAAPLAAPAWK